MKFKTYLEHITGIGLYAMISLILFFAFFSALTIWALRVNRKYINTLKQIPFSGPEQSPFTEI